MAQIIKHRRGSLEALSAVTSSLQKGELVIASGSSNLSVTNGASIVFAVPENGQVQAVNRILVGDSAPNTFAAGTYNGMLNGVPYYASGSSTLFLLGEGANQIPNLVGNIQPFSASVATSINALSASIGSGTIGQSVSALNTFSGSTLVSLAELNSFSSSQLEKDSALATYTGSVDTTLSNIATDQITQDGRLDSLEGFESDVESKFSTLATYTASVDTRFTEIGVVSGSLIASASAASVSISNLNSFTQSFSQSVATDFSASNASITALSASVSSVTGEFSSSVATSFSSSLAAQTAYSASVATTISNVSSSVSSDIASLEAFSSSFDTAFNISGSDVEIAGNLIVKGTTTQVESTTIQLGDNIIELNGSGVANGGLYVKDVTSPNTATGSLVWDSTNDYWKAGVKDSESKILVAGGDGVVSGSSQITISDTTGYGDFSGSVSASIAAVVANVGSGVGVSITNLNSFSSSALTRLDNLESFESSTETRLTEIGVVSGSLFASASAAKSTNDTQDGRLSNLEAKSASVDTSVAALNSSSASQQTQLDLLSSKTGSYATTGSNVFYGTQTVSASFNVSGSTNFNGAVAVDNSNMNLTNSSSLNLTNGSSIYVNGNGVISGSIVGIGNVTAFSTSVDSRLDTLEAAVGEGSNIDVRLDNLEATSASVNTSVAELNTFSASAKTQFTQIGVVSGSLFASASAAKSTNDTQDGRLDNLETTSASVNVSISNLNSKSASVDTSISNLNSFTSSFGTTFSSSVDSRLDALEGTGTIQGLGTENNVTFAKVTTTGDVIIGGDLVVQGNTVTLNTAQLVVEDKLITLASGSTSSATADGAGIEIAGADANFVYQHSSTSFTSSVALIAPAVTASVNLGTSAGNTKRIAFRNTNGNLDLVGTGSVAGDLLQWNGSDFVMSNVIDGGSF